MCERSEHILTKTTLQSFYKEPIIEVVDKTPLITLFYKTLTKKVYKMSFKIKIGKNFTCF